MLFSDYMLYWLKVVRATVEETTWGSYVRNVKGHIVPYFEGAGYHAGGAAGRGTSRAFTCTSWKH